MRIFRWFKKDLAREVSDWIGDGLIEPAQGEAILARYGVSLADSRSSSLGYYVLSALAVLFIGLALILLVSHNWEQIPRMTRMLSLAGLTLLINLSGLHHLRKGSYRAGVLWLLLGSLCYGVTIMLIAQIYHLGEHFPDGIYWWAVGVLPLVFITRSRLLALLVLALSTLWMYTETGSGFLPATYPVFMLSCLWLVWAHKSSVLIFIWALAGLLLWVNLLLAWQAGGWQDYDVQADQLAISVALGLLLKGLACWLERQAAHRLQDYGQALQLWLLRLGILGLLVLSYDDSWQELLRSHYRLGLWLPLILTAATLLACWLAGGSGRKAWGALLTNGAFCTLVTLAVQQQWLESLPLAIATNLMLVVSGIWLIHRGIDDAITHLFYTGIGILLLTALFRYFDLIGDYIGGAVLFMVAAIVLLGAARYWRMRMLQREDEHA